MRLKACIEAGLTEVPVIIADDLTPEEQRRFIATDNISTGEWDWDVLARDWDGEELTDWGLDVPEFVLFEEDGEAEEDDFDVPLGGSETSIVPGDLFQIGDHRLICGDSTKPETFSKLFSGSVADLVVTDPPYNVAYEGGTKDKLTIMNDSMKSSDFYLFLKNFYSSLVPHTKKGGCWYVWHADSEGVSFRQALLESGVLIKQCLIWVKNQFVLGRQDYQWKHEPCLEGVVAEDWEWVKSHEPCLYGWREGSAHFWKGGRKQTTILEYDKPLRNAEHPTMKPVPLIGCQISNSSRRGEIVADGFGGSGTTMVAAHQLGRKAYLVEFDPRYCQVIVDRMIKLDPELVILKNGEVL